MIEENRKEGGRGEDREGKGEGGTEWSRRGGGRKGRGERDMGW